jgi:hypothetical protein
MKSYKNLLAKLIKDEQGGEVLEYALTRRPDRRRRHRGDRLGRARRCWPAGTR